MANVYWQGADGNIWFKDGSGTYNKGKPLATGDNGFDAQGFSAEAKRIADPNPPKPAASTAPAGGGGGSSSYVDKSNSIALNEAGLKSSDSQLSGGIAAIQKALGGLMGRYDEEAATNKENYTTQSDTNQGNRQSGIQKSYVNAAQGRRGLFGTLQSLGALSGDGVTLANRAVQQGANEDLTGVNENFSTNQVGLDTSYKTFEREDKARRDNGKTAAEEAETGVRNQVAKSRQQFYTNLANDYAAMGNMAKAREYTNLAAALYSDLATTSIPSSNLAYSPASYQPATLANYIGEANNTQVKTSSTPDSFGLPGLVASPTRRRQLV